MTGPFTFTAHHTLNLCVASSCKIPIIRDMMDNVRAVSDFFNNSPKRVIVLQEIISQLVPSERKHKLLNVCIIRSVLPFDGLIFFQRGYLAIFVA